MFWAVKIWQETHLGSFSIWNIKCQLFFCSYNSYLSSFLIQATFKLPQLKVYCSLQPKTKVHCMPFGQSCMCLDPMLIVFSFFKKIKIKQKLNFFHTHLNMIGYWSYCKIKVDKTHLRVAQENAFHLFLIPLSFA